MTTTATSYESAATALAAVLDAVPAEGWAVPSPCAGWSARDVLAHLVDTQRDFLTGHGADLGPAPDVDGGPVAAWRDHAKRVADALSDEEFAATAYDGHFGPTTIGATFEQFYVWDVLVHRWDIAASVGADAGLTEGELDRIESGADSFGDALYMDGICRPGVDAPADAGRPARVLARLGRRA
jgi:uncharacterized protein (TIGR03086 family)